MTRAENWLVGSGELGAWVRSHHWSQTPLGAIETWSDDLKTAVQIFLTELDQTQSPKATQRDADLHQQHATVLYQVNQLNAFRVKLSAALRPLTDASEIQTIAARILGETIGANRVIYIDARSDGKENIIHCNFTNGVTPLSGEYGLEDYRCNLIADHQAERTQVVTDIPNHPKYTDLEKTRYRKIEIAAHIDVPLVKHHQCVALLTAQQSTPRQWTATEVKLVEETAEQTWAAVERAYAETALRESKAKYCTLLESIDEGFCIVQMLFDENNTPVDYRFLEVNSVFEQQTGLQQAIAKTARQLVPDLEEFWFETYGKVALTGEPVRFENGSASMNRWFDVYACRTGQSEERKVAIFFKDISDRKRAEDQRQQAQELLRQAAQLDACRVSLADALRLLADPVEIQATASRVLGEHLGANRVAYFEVQGNNYVIERDYVNGVDALAGSYPIGGFGPKLLATYQRGCTVSSSNVAADPYLSPDQQSAYAAVQIGAYIGVPLIKEGKFVAGLAVHNAAPRDWQPEAVTLTEEVADRTWAAVERARAESALRESEAKYRALFESMDQGFGIAEILVDEAGHPIDYRMLEINPQFERLTGQSSEAFLTGQTVREVAPELEEEWYEFYGSVGVTGVPAHREIHAQEWGRWFEVSAYRTGAAAQRRVAILFTEITQRKWAEQALRQSEERFRLMADAVPQIVWITDAQGRVEFFNKQWSNYTGVPYEPTTAAAVAANFVHPEDSDRTLEVFTEAQRRGSIFSVEHRIRSAAGTYRWFLVRAEPYRDPQTGEILRWFGASVDIHDRKQAEANLRESEARYRLLAEAIPQFVWITDAEGHNQYVNQRFCDYTALSVEQLLGSNWVSIIHPDDWQTTHDRWMIAMQTGQFYEAEYRLRAHDGSYRWFLGQAIPLKDEQDGICQWFGTCTDIEPQKQIEQARLRLLAQEQAAREQAENANRIKDEFLAVLSHELRSPLNPILGWTQLLQNGKLDEARKIEALKTIERNAKLQTQLIEDLLDISRIMRGKLSLTAAPVSLTFVISAAVETVRLAAESKQIRLQLELDSTVASISGDAARLQQVVWNLLSNAVKFTPRGGQVTVELSQLNQWAQIRVIDTGKGINPQFLPYIFEYFRQEDGSTTRQFGGLGLGLAIARQIVELHGGSVWAESRGEGHGATFIVQLPVMWVAPIEPEPVQTPLETGQPLANLRILLVDDEPDTREFQAFLLEQNGATVTAVASGLEALQALEQSTPDILVSDIGMAQMDGYMLLQQIHSRHPAGKVRAIALTAYATEIDQQRGLQAGFQAHITKPVEPDVLIRTIQNVWQKQGDR